MTITIPNYLVDSAAWLLLALGVLILACLALIALCKCVTNALRARHHFWCAVVWLCTKQQRTDAKKWTVGQFRNLRQKLGDENPQFLKSIQRVFEQEHNGHTFDDVVRMWQEAHTELAKSARRYENATGCRMRFAATKL